MLDLGQRYDGVRKVLQEEADEKGYPFSLLEDNGAKLKELFPDLGYIGGGGESVVIEHPNDPDKVVTIGYAKDGHFGVFPYAETYHMHKVLSALYPSDFADVFSVTGITPRSAEKELILGKQTEDENFDELKDRAKAIKAELTAIGFRISIDYNPCNYIEKDGVKKYVDYVTVFDIGYTAVADNSVIIAIFDRNNPNLRPEERSSRIKQLLTNINRLKELKVVNILFQDMVTANNFNIDKNVIASALGESSNESSVNRIAIILSKAANAVQTKGYKYDDRWVI